MWWWDQSPFSKISKVIKQVEKAIFWRCKSKNLAFHLTANEWGLIESDRSSA